MALSVGERTAETENVTIVVSEPSGLGKFMLIILYFAICLLVAFLGRNRGLGFLATLLLSILLTPLVATIILLIIRGAAEQPPVAQRAALAGGHGGHAGHGEVICYRCNHKREADKSVEYCTHCGEPL